MKIIFPKRVFLFEKHLWTGWLLSLGNQPAWRGGTCRETQIMSGWHLTNEEQCFWIGKEIDGILVFMQGFLR